MILLSGRMIPGLDEFMLRLGHLKVLSNVATEMSGSRYRVEKATAELLTSDSTVGPEEIPALTEYLYRKRLCVSRSASVSTCEDFEGEAQEVRYPGLVIEELPAGALRLTDGKDASNAATVWWQDRCLASPDVPSKVGAITVSAKSGSKTGLSHIIDWAEATGLISSTAQATPEARLLAKLDGKCNGESWIGNPYIISTDRILLSFIVLSSDLDIFSRLLVALAATTWPLKKRQAAVLFAKTLEGLVDEADGARYLTSRQKFHLTEQLRELERAARKKSGDVGGASTTWHRTASRLETYVDLGILTKKSKDPRDRFEYTYYPTPVLSAFVESLKAESDPLDWLERNLVACLLGSATRQDAMDLVEMKEPLQRLLNVIRSPTTSYQIGTLAVGLATVFAETKSPVSIRCARASLEELARTHPEIARLARGTSGQRAEYISLDPRKV
ncbi:MAG: hypothetical protein KJZ84_13870 [Bryobacteraceae bacterium]|nr:hypothetical protein [Bryobacteraceae bacterium]